MILFFPMLPNFSKILPIKYQNFVRTHYLLLFFAKNALDQHNVKLKRKIGIFMKIPN